MSEPTPGHWTGVLDLHIRNSRNWDAGTLSVTVGLNDIAVSRARQQLGVLERTAFADWLAYPRTPFQCDCSPTEDHGTETVWSMHGDLLVVAVGPHAAESFVMLRPEVDLLRQAILT